MNVNSSPIVHLNSVNSTIPTSTKQSSTQEMVVPFLTYSPPISSNFEMKRQETNVRSPSKNMSGKKRGVISPTSHGNAIANILLTPTKSDSPNIENRLKKRRLTAINRSSAEATLHSLAKSRGNSSSSVLDNLGKTMCTSAKYPQTTKGEILGSTENSSRVLRDKGKDNWFENFNKWRSHLSSPLLENWVQLQRDHYRLLKQNKKSNMTRERIIMLEGAGFIWDIEREKELTQNIESDKSAKYKRSLGSSDERQITTTAPNKQHINAPGYKDPLKTESKQLSNSSTPKDAASSFQSNEKRLSSSTINQSPIHEESFELCHVDARDINKSKPVAGKIKKCRGRKQSSSLFILEQPCSMGQTGKKHQTTETVTITHQELEDKLVKQHQRSIERAKKAALKRSKIKLDSINMSEAIDLDATQEKLTETDSAKKPTDSNRNSTLIPPLSLRRDSKLYSTQSDSISCLEDKRLSASSRTTVSTSVSKSNEQLLENVDKSRLERSASNAVLESVKSVGTGEKSEGISATSVTLSTPVPLNCSAPSLNIDSRNRNELLYSLSNDEDFTVLREDPKDDSSHLIEKAKESAQNKSDYDSSSGNGCTTTEIVHFNKETQTGMNSTSPAPSDHDTLSQALSSPSIITKSPSSLDTVILKQKRADVSSVFTSSSSQLELSASSSLHLRTELDTPPNSGVQQTQQFHSVNKEPTTNSLLQLHHGVVESALLPSQTLLTKNQCPHSNSVLQSLSKDMTSQCLGRSHPSSAIAPLQMFEELDDLDIPPSIRAQNRDKVDIVLAKRQYQKKLTEFGRLELEAKMMSERMRVIEKRIEEIDSVFASKGADIFKYPQNSEFSSHSYDSESTLTRKSVRKQSPYCSDTSADNYAGEHQYSSQKSMKGRSRQERPRLSAFYSYAQRSKNQQESRRTFFQENEHSSLIENSNRRKSQCTESDVRDGEFSDEYSQSSGVHSLDYPEKVDLGSTRRNSTSNVTLSARHTSSAYSNVKQSKKRRQSERSMVQGTNQLKTRRGFPGRISRDDESEIEVCDSHDEYEQSSCMQRVIDYHDETISNPVKRPLSSITAISARHSLASPSKFYSKMRKPSSLPTQFVHTFQHNVNKVQSEKNSRTNVAENSKLSNSLGLIEGMTNRVVSSSPRIKTRDKPVIRGDLKNVSKANDWLAGEDDGSDSDWDFDGPMILPPPPL